MSDTSGFAVCISGQARNWAASARRLHGMLGGPGTRYFVSLWRRRGTKRHGTMNHHQVARRFDAAAGFLLPPSFQAEFLHLRLPALGAMLEAEEARAGEVSAEEVRDLLPGAEAEIEADAVLADPPPLRGPRRDGGFTRHYDGNSTRMVWRWWHCDLLRQRAEIRAGRPFAAVLRSRPDMEFGRLARPDPLPARTVLVPELRAGDEVADMFALADADSMARWCDARALLLPYAPGGLPWRNIHRALHEHAARQGLQLQQADWAGDMAAEERLPVGLLRAAAEASVPLLPPELRGETEALALSLRVLEAGPAERDALLRRAAEVAPGSAAPALLRLLLARERAGAEGEAAEALLRAARCCGPALRRRPDLVALLRPLAARDGRAAALLAEVA
ncbi:hypothetical protein [Roseomonas sp. BN140053]|uniref:hypothetical protein n=1 Tax=Roseomonas sp. BN140053 TaxID=3391898 RepID=UPI0039E874D8